MNCLLMTCLLLTALRLTACSPPGGPLQRLARIALPGGRAPPSLARSLDASSSLARRVSEDVDFDDEEETIGKRQFDDYGHMRFGRNAPKFEDYGHLRYGK